MKIHPALFVLLMLCSLAGTYAVGRMGRAPSVAKTAPAVESAAPTHLVTIGPTQSAEIKTAGETIRVEGSATIVPSTAASNNR